MRPKVSLISQWGKYQSQWIKGIYMWNLYFLCEISVSLWVAACAKKQVQQKFPFLCLFFFFFAYLLYGILFYGASSLVYAIRNVPYFCGTGTIYEHLNTKNPCYLPKTWCAGWMGISFFIQKTFTWTNKAWVSKVCTNHVNFSMSVACAGYFSCVESIHGVQIYWNVLLECIGHSVMCGNGCQGQVEHCVLTNQMGDAATPQAYQG